MTNDKIINHISSSLFTDFVLLAEQYGNKITQDDIENILANLYVGIESVMLPDTIVNKRDALDFMALIINSFHKNMVTKMYKELDKKYSVIGI